MQLPLFISAFLSMLFVAQADFFYNSTGSSVGRAETDSSGNTRYYDKSGSFMGSSRKSGNSVRYYDKSGSYQGSTRR